MIDRSEKITINLADVASARDVHKRLSSALNFPDYYGMNWDAFDEVIRDFPMPSILEIVGAAHFKRTLPREFELMQSSLANYNAENPNTHVEVIWV